jgi:mRNA interferase RelE/StbE
LRVEYKSSFVRDLKKVRDRELKDRIRDAIELTERARSLQEIENIKKLRGGDRYYRIRVGDYRLGLLVEGDTITFVRCLHRRDVYRYFP